MPKNKGQMIGREYFSTAMPQGQGGELEFDSAQADTILQVLQSGVTREQVLAAQDLMIRLGYLDEGDADATLGPMTQGAARRYQSNYSMDILMESLKDKWDSLFD